MVLTVIGGSASGKSAYAEDRILEFAKQHPDSPLIYLATMLPYGEEGQKRIARHRKLREGKGFRTAEAPYCSSPLPADGTAIVLLEDLPNLAANELFASNNQGRQVTDLQNEIAARIRKLKQRTQHLVIVTGQLDADGISYDASTQTYLRLVGELNRQVAALSDEVIEVVYGIPLALKNLPPGPASAIRTEK